MCVKPTRKLEIVVNMKGLIINFTNVVAATTKHTVSIHARLRYLQTIGTLSASLTRNAYRVENKLSNCFVFVYH